MAKKKGTNGLVPYFATNDEQGKTPDKSDAVEVAAGSEDPTACKECGQKMLVKGTRTTHRWYRCENKKCKEFEIMKKDIPKALF